MDSDSEQDREFDDQSAIAREHGDFPVARQLPDGSLEVLPAKIMVNDETLVIGIGDEPPLAIPLAEMQEAIDRELRRR